MELVAAGLPQHPDNPQLIYNLACYESLAGRHDDALEHLRRALELAPDAVPKWAADDTDLDPLRSLPRFPL